MDDLTIKLDIPELLPREKDNMNHYFGMTDAYNGEELLSEVFKLSHKIFPNFNNPDPDFSEWHICNIFGYRYTHGFVREKAVDVEEQKRKYFKDNQERIEARKKSVDNMACAYLYKQPLYDKIDQEEETAFHYTCLKNLQDKELNMIKEKFLRYDIVASLKAMNIDVIKFWYVFLWIRDLVLSKTNHVDKMTNSVMEELNNLMNQIKIVIDDEKKSHSFSLDLKANNRRIGQGIKNKYTLELIKRLIENHLETYDRSEYSADICELNSRTALEKNLDRAATHKLFLFHKYMKVYLQDKGGKKNCLIGDVLPEITNTKIGKTESVSIDKEWLIARLCWAAELGLYDVYKSGKEDKRKILTDKIKGVKESDLDFKRNQYQPIYTFGYLHYYGR